eukprot:gnl/MRDRNA2_/MRDRNA2_66238_c0_seq1.p1 gnl/MRDRNA2_/MRDRNA2_66238_c0~~gnl/MRDRNA2_/MRDRNA2_66238_c0_seq1.p1  ORF type:complete len:591 (-),score=59.54 gnl/MRDRNA2_/MRDRNA2_66238_c0_seq1:4-1716(-)
MSTPTEELWRSWNFLQRLDWAARENSRQGPRFPTWIVAACFGRFLIQNLAFVLLLQLVPSDQTLEGKDQLWQTFLRYTAWTYGLDCAGYRNGPLLDGRFTPWPLGMFTIARYRLTRGSLKVPMFACFGSHRTALDVASFVALLVALSVSVFFPALLREAMVVAVVSAAWGLLSDHQQFLASQSTTHFHVLLAGCFPAQQGGVACAQIHVVLVWLGSGLGKIGPWFAFVNGPFLSGSLWLRGRQWLWKLLYRSEDDLRPTFAVQLLGHVAPHLEWVAPLLLFVPGSAFSVVLGVVTLLAMHVYILCMPAMRDIYAWNGWFMVAAVNLFGGRVAFGFDFGSWASAPYPLQLWFVGETLLVLFGVLRPDLISYQTGHRNWAGNWSQAVIFLRKSAASKLTDSVITYGRPAWDAVPESIQLGPKLTEKDASFAKELITYKLLGNYWLSTMNLKVLPSLVQRTLMAEPIQDFYVMHGNQLCDTCMGSFFCLSWFPLVVSSLQKVAHFEERDFLCIHVGSFPFQGGCRTSSTKWQILDASAGVVASGTLHSDAAWTLATLPSACESAEWLLGGEAK